MVKITFRVINNIFNVKAISKCALLSVYVLTLKVDFSVLFDFYKAPVVLVKGNLFYLDEVSLHCTFVFESA